VKSSSFYGFFSGFSITRPWLSQGTAAVSAGMRPLLFTATAAILGTSKDASSKGWQGMHQEIWWDSWGIIYIILYINIIYILIYIYICYIYYILYIYYDTNDMRWDEMIWYDIWYMIYDIWYMIYDIWYMIYDMIIWGCTWESQSISVGFNGCENLQDIIDFYR